MNKPECTTYPNGHKVWHLNGKCHREDGPAVERASGAKEWRLNGKLHREDGPASEWANGNKEWWLNGKLHREDGPASEWANGTKEWWLNDEEVDPETIVDLWLAKNIYCFYNVETNSLEFE
jgi:hypothetical protein